MKTNYSSPLPFGGLITLSPDEIDSSLSFADASWLTMRKQQMDIKENCIFPRRESKSIASRLQPVRAILIMITKILVR